jgi:hypothetical protein
MERQKICFDCGVDLKDHVGMSPSEIVQDNVKINYWGMYPKPFKSVRVNQETRCAQCATRWDKALMKNGYHPHLSYTSGECGQPLEITNGVMSMYWTVLYTSHSGEFWQAEFMHNRAIWRASCRHGHAIARKLYDLPAEQEQEERTRGENLRLLTPAR